MNDIDEIVAEMWTLALAYDDEDDLRFKARSEMWWGITVQCEHGTFTANSDGYKPGSGFARLLLKFKEAHQ